MRNRVSMAISVPPSPSAKGANEGGSTKSETWPGGGGIKGILDGSTDGGN